MFDYTMTFTFVGRAVTSPLENTVLNYSSGNYVFGTTAVGTRCCSSGLSDYGTTTVDF